MVPSPTAEALATIIDRTTGGHTDDVQSVIDGETILQMRQLAREVPLAPNVRDFAIRVVLGSQPDSPYAPESVRKFVRYGSSPRGAQAIVNAAKIRAVLAGRYNVAFEDIITVAPAALRHRVLRNFEGEAEGIEPDMIVKQIMEKAQTESEVKV